MLIPTLCPLTAGVDSASDVYGYLQRLWDFLRQCSVGMSETTHLCCLVSLVFREQDDDMMDAAKALLSIFLHHRYIILQFKIFKAAIIEISYIDNNVKMGQDLMSLSCTLTLHGTVILAALLLLLQLLSLRL